MVGILVQLGISWALLWFIEKKDLRALGIVPTGPRLFQLGAGALLAIFCCTAYFLIKIFLEKSQWAPNPEFNSFSLLKSSWWVMNSVLFEELIFRGALLYLAIKFLGIKRACLLSAACFGVYHWFSFGAFGNPVAMIFVFLMTSVWGYTFAMSFAKTNSLYLPIGLHFGWNFISIVIFSTGPLGKQYLIIHEGQPLEGLFSLTVFLFQVLALPLLAFTFLRLIRQTQKNMPPQA